MKVPEALYAKRTTDYSTETRYGSTKLGVVGVIVRFRQMVPIYLWQIGRLGLSYGPSCGVEAGLADLTPAERGPYRFFYRKNGMALAVNWGGRKS